MNSRDTSTDIEFARHSRQLFHGHLAQLDGATRAKLRAARLRAVRADAQWQPFGPMPPRWLAAGALGALATALVVVYTLGPGPASPDRGRFDVANSSDLELLLGGEDLDVVQNLEFYAWLEQQRGAKPAAKTAETDKSG